MQITFLGTGSSLGTPIISCNCAVCKSEDFRDNRLRSSVMVEINNKTIIIDAGPDFREQMLRFNPASKLDAVLITHAHRDHISGLDDVRPFNFIQQKDTRIYAEQNVLEIIKNQFFYSFDDENTQGVPKFELHQISTKNFEIDGIKIIPIRVFHSMPMLGFRIDDFTYITDAKIIEKQEIEKIKNTRILVLNALRDKLHPSHFNLDEALALIEQIKPQKAYLTHMSHRIGLQADLEKILPKNVFPAYDGLTIS